MDELNMCNKCGNDKLLADFFVEVSQTFIICKQCTIYKGRERRTNGYDKENFYVRDYFQHNKKTY